MDMQGILARQKAAHLRDGAPTAEERINRIDRCIRLGQGHDRPAQAVHVGMGRLAGRFGMVEQLNNMGLLGPDTTYVHSCYLSDDEWRQIRAGEDEIGYALIGLGFIVEGLFPMFGPILLAQVIWAGFRIGEVSCPTKYFPEASSINFSRSVKYGFGVLATAACFRLARMGLISSRRFGTLNGGVKDR